MSAGVEWTLGPRGPLRGTLQVPGDKSVSHRSLLFHALANGPAVVHGLLESEDVAATHAAVRALGVHTERQSDGSLRIEPPANGLSASAGTVDCGNSGTSIRLLCGLLAGQGVAATLTGDDSLSRRPMLRVVDPLRAMGAQIDGRDNGRFPPLQLASATLHSARHDLAIASAQVKSCLLLAGLRCGVAVREPRVSRDHTERMLRAMGADLIDTSEGWLELAPSAELSPLDLTVPADVSAAAFWMVAASIVPGSDVLLPAVGDNPTRTGVVDALLAMGADLERSPREVRGEPLADLRIRATELQAARIDGDLALRALDELPVLAVAAATAHGTTVIADAHELRVKESDRIARVVAGLRSCGVQVDEQPDGMVIEGCGGPLPGGGEVDAHGDHRIAMAFAVAAMHSQAPIHITGAHSVRSSYPAFLDHLEALVG